MDSRKLYVLFISAFTLFYIPVWAQTNSAMTYNIKYDNKNDTLNHWDKRKSKLVQLINHYQPSFVGTQEGLHHQVQYLDSSLVHYNFVGVGRKDGKKKGEYSALFYDKNHFTLLSSSTFWLSEAPDHPSVGWDAALERVCSYGLFEENKTSKKIWVFNTHFDHIGKEARSNSVKLILQKMKQLNPNNNPVLLLGDFNLHPNEAPIGIIKSQMDDGLEISETPFFGPPGTFNGFENKPITRRIDYIFSKRVNVKSYEHIDHRLHSDRHISDHLPVFMKWETLR